MLHGHAAQHNVLVIARAVCRRPVKNAGAEVPMPYAANLEAAALPQVADIVKMVKAQLNRK
jgi:pyruvate/2-oxoglutarate/acetoin dehydrogenase E1 component